MTIKAREYVKSIPSNMAADNSDWTGGASPLITKRPAKFHGNKVGFRNQAQVGPSQETLPATVPNDEEIVPRLDRPAHASIGADVLRIGIILYEARQDKIRIPGISSLHLPQFLHKVSFGHVSEIIFGIDFNLHTSLGRSPLKIIFLLS